MRVVVVPSTPALLPEYASLDDPVADLRTAVREAVAWLVADGPVGVVLSATPAAGRLADHLLADRAGDGPGVLVLGNGSAMRTEKAPGHFDVRAEGFDKALGQALRDGDSAGLAGLDRALAAELWADVAGLVRLGEEIDLSGAETRVDYDDDPYGVQYWVVRFECGS